MTIIHGWALYMGGHYTFYFTVCILLIHVYVDINVSTYVLCIYLCAIPLKQLVYVFMLKVFMELQKITLKMDISIDNTIVNTRKFI
jgi:hypothetical protein